MMGIHKRVDPTLTALESSLMAMSWGAVIVGHSFRSLEMNPLLLIFLTLLVCLTSSCSDEAIVRSDKPLTRAEALKGDPGYPFPPSAHSIYYLVYGGGLQDLEAYTRFDVAPEELDAAVDALVTGNNAEMKRSLPYPRVAISAAEFPTPMKSFLPMPWWEPSAITTGYYRGHIDGFALRIFVDQARSRIYIYQND
jgi:hypothetical protein